MRRPRAATAPSVAGPNRNAPECEVDTDHYYAALERLANLAGRGGVRVAMMEALNQWCDRKERDADQRGAGEERGGVA